MIDCWKILFVALAVTNSHAFQCSSGNEGCTCQPSHTGDIEIYCVTENDSTYTVNIQPEDYVQISCVNWLTWQDFRLTSTLPGKELKSMLFRMCGLPQGSDNNGTSSLGDVARQLGIQKVEKLLFQSFGNLSDKLTRQRLRGFPATKKLVLSTNGFSNIPKDLFMDFPELTWLDLRENNLNLSAGIFDNTPKLEVLELGNNGLSKIESGTFDKLTKLRLLNIWKNQLTEIEPTLFDKLTSLISIDMNTNKLTTLPPKVFAKLNKLEIVYLFGNNFSYLPEGLFDGNPELRVIKLYNNKMNLTTLPDYFFANLTKLETLVLKRNGLKILPENIFWGASSLTNLSLNSNLLVTLPRNIFKELRNLRMLELNYNNIEKLPDRIFAELSKLDKLDLSKNRIVTVSRHLFDGLKSLTQLNMENNRLRTIHGMAFIPVPNLRVARFSHNELTLKSEMAPQFQDIFGTRSPFHSCTFLEELHLAYNNISEIYSDWTISGTHLRLLDLKYNNIDFISMSDLQFVSNNIRVNLTHNKISNIQMSGAELVARYQEFPRDVIILIEHNPLNCDCNLYDFLRYLDGKMHPNVQNYLHIIPGNLTCATPDWLNNVEIANLRSKTLKCIEEEYLHVKSKCPMNCMCWVRPEDTTRIIDCSYKNLNELLITKSEKSYGPPVEGFHIELNLTGNKLKEIPSIELLGSQYVTSLLLSHNNISHIPLEKLPENLQILELDNNNISTVNPDVLDYLKNSSSLKKLTLHKNPWRCDCDDRDLLSFVQLKLVDIPDLLQVTCDGMNTTMSEMTVNEFCPLDTAMIVGISMTIALTGLFIGGLVALYYRYEQEIKVWLYAHQFCLWFVTEDELDKDKTYDAFISYSHKDEHFVVNELVPKLENGPRPYKLCLHFRDWLAGEWIPTQITRSVEQSRRTIVIVSPNFLESVWGAMEFRAAHRQAMSEGRARVILILYGDIGPTDNLDAEFKAYLSMNTYVKWGDPWFWDKLRYALPHPPELTRYAMKKKIFQKHYPSIQINGEKKELIYPNGMPETPPAATTPPADSLKVFICDPNEKDPRVNSDENEVSKLNANNRRDLVPQCEAIHKHLINKIQCTTV